MSRDPMEMTPNEFEEFVKRRLQAHRPPLKGFAVHGKRTIDGIDGDYEIDASAEFEALGGRFLVVVECKRHKNPIKRELVQVLRDKTCALAAHKAMMFSTSRYQSGAIIYAQEHGIALFHVQQHGTTTITKAEGVEPPPGEPEFVAWRVSVSRNGREPTLSLLDPHNTEVLADFFGNEEGGENEE